MTIGFVFTAKKKKKGCACIFLGKNNHYALNIMFHINFWRLIHHLLQYCFNARTAEIFRILLNFFSLSV